MTSHCDLCATNTRDVGLSLQVEISSRSQVVWLSKAKSRVILVYWRIVSIAIVINHNHWLFLDSISSIKVPHKPELQDQAFFVVFIDRVNLTNLRESPKNEDHYESTEFHEIEDEPCYSRIGRWLYIIDYSSVPNKRGGVLIVEGGKFSENLIPAPQNKRGWGKFGNHI